jgi:bifunctional UDP-N-acetylglucosamine pyrophosphorylase/glucosamine-1-phosphate N-acetyltransferase
MAMFETPNVICTATTQHPWDYGIVTIEGQLAKGITEKPAKGTEASDQKIQTIYKLDSEFIQTLSQLQSSEYSFEAALDILMKANKVGHLQLSTCLASLKYPWHLFDLQTELFELQTSYLHPTAQISSTAILDESKGSIVIEANAQIGDFVKIVGPVFIGENCRVGDYSFIRQTSLEADSTIGANSEVVRSVIFSRSSLHYSYVADSIIGNHVKIGAGFITANKRLNRETIQIRVKNKPTNTGRTAVGAIIGEDVNLGIRVSTMPGVMIGPRATVFPGICLYNSVPSDEVIKK